MSPILPVLPRGLRGRLATGAACLVGVMLLWPAAASAHSPIDGIEGFYVGFLHPLSTAGQVLALVAIGLVVGRGDRSSFARAWSAFAALVGGGILLGQAVGTSGHEDTALLGVAAVSALIAAVAPERVFTLRPLQPGAVAAGLGGLLLGLASTPDAGPLRATMLVLAGSFVGLNFAFLYLAGGTIWFLDRYAARWARIGVRVLASWIATIAVLMGALVFAAS